MDSLTLEVQPLSFSQGDEQWLPGLKPYAYQSRVYRRVHEALTRKETLCLFLVTPTGSGKTLGSYAYAINQRVPAFGVYPTNELIRDQENALKPWLDPHDEHALLRIDSQQLDHWQDTLDLARHSSTLETLMNWQPTILTNPDILFYTFFGLYKGSEGLCQRLFVLVGQYRLFVFDEFHLYNVKQMADVAFLVGTLNAINPRWGRVFLFASATPKSPALRWLQDNLRLQVEVVESEPSPDADARTIAHPLRLTVLPADLRAWQGDKALLDHLSELQRFLQQYPQARLVTILDSVAGSIRLAQRLREQFPDTAVGEVHGLTSQQEREAALGRPFTVGTSTIEVGIDFKDRAEKDVLIYEARTASQFIQRFGRVARHAKRLPIPNWAIALVPEYVYHFLAARAAAPALSRQELYDLVDQAYQPPEDFAHYVATHAPVEFQEASVNAQRLFQPDDRPRMKEELGRVIQGLTGQASGRAWALHRQYGEQGILAPLLTFRGGGFEAAIVDERGSDPGFPIKRYDLMFLLRRGILAEIDEQEYLERVAALAKRWPEEAARERRYGKRIERGPEKLLGVYGYFRLTGFQEQARRVWFEVGEEAVYGLKGQVVPITGLRLATDPELRLAGLNRHLQRKSIVAWFLDRHPASIKLGRALPPLFEVHELRVQRIGGKLSDAPWSIAFNQDAFFLDSLGIGRGRGPDWRRSDEEEIIL